MAYFRFNFQVPKVEVSEKQATQLAIAIQAAGY